MKLTRRQMITTSATLAATTLLPACKSPSAGNGSSASSIDRQTVITRHNPHNQKLNPYSALSLGNGNFSFTADITGLQTFPDPYNDDFPLCTAATWGWHSFPAGPNIHPDQYKFKDYDTHGRPVGYAASSTGQLPLYNYLRENPHHFHLGRVALLLKKPDGSNASPSDLSNIDQTLDLWNGAITSIFQFLGQTVRVRTAVHPTLDALAVRIDSTLLSKQQVAARILFPYASSDFNMADWNSPTKHTTHFEPVTNTNRSALHRTLDNDHYSVYHDYQKEGGHFDQISQHEYALFTGNEFLEFVLLFSPTPTDAALPSFNETVHAAAAHWSNFWSTGGVIDLSASTDPRAHELERRAVLSQYVTALNCTGPMPPPETGILFNSWYGKSHLEMHWWHGVHFAAWNRFPLLASTLDFYTRIMPVAKATAVRQGYDGARWPKMVGPDGRDSPSPIAPLLIWQQPHPIYYAELAYRQSPTPQTLNKWKEIVLQTADFMASFAFLEQDRNNGKGEYTLGPPIKTVPEDAETTTTKNPTYELAYWRFGLSTAQVWRSRLGLAPNPRYADVLARLSPLPQENGLYLMQEGMSDTYTKWSYEHPSILGAYGAQPGLGVDPAIMNNSFREIMRVWQWDRCWGWDFPMAAMTASKLGLRDAAFDALLIGSPKNLYHPNGHVYQRPKLTAYLPANGGFLSAMAMLALNNTPANAKKTQTTITNGKWSMRSEKISPLL